ncbi:UDP-glucose flavonoid 3-O-glucosyltransferase 7-like [Telopea speciosissima]|uniref:UDP-glucose flavonoid 3-O-glucosyltransferase 7-like n=1 Tax=Telopea speciosissima TaxID=54955 RepID=UPI001CC7996B|nr:UDP-glucose flavonoid 3-O-glucosyltransferase 7-like [Telopea speciosissima]
MGSETHKQFHAFFVPLMAQGHLIPMTDITRLFASRGVKVTILTTPSNASLFSNTIDRDVQLGLDISVQLIPFPSVEARLPEGCENLSSTTSPSMTNNFSKALDLLQPPFEFKLLQQQHPADCIISDMFFPWVTDSAIKLGILRFIFHGTSFFSCCVMDSIKRYAPHENLKSDSYPFIVPRLPDQIELTRSQVPETKSEFAELLERVRKSEERSYGVLVNNFYELEPAYADHYKKVIGRTAWDIGPISLRNRDFADKAQRGNSSSYNIDGHEYCLNWLDKKKSNLVLYVCFGSVTRFTASQLLEITMALDTSGHPFIWVVRSEEREIPEGFKERNEGKGLIIRDWAPQVLILDHPAVGGFVTHCGWNSTLESVSAGVPMITWPLFAEQFYNEKLVTQVLRIGVSVGANEWSGFVGERNAAAVKREDIETAVDQLMGGGEEAERMRSRATELK